MRKHFIWYSSLTILTAVLSALAVGNFSLPLSDGDDTDQYEYTGYYLFRNLSFRPWPTLDLVNNQTFYPYGTTQVFLPWGFERDCWYALGYWLFDGPGPFLQYYYVVSLVITAVGTFALLQPAFGVGKSFLTGLVVSVFNFYALWKFPVHMNVCVAHWTVLCLVATYRLLFDLLNRRPVSLAFLLVWAALHVLSLGLELGYVAGFALTFTTLSLPVMVYLLIRRFPTPRDWLAQGIRYVTSELHRQPVLNGLLLALLVASLLLYLPLTLQIAFTAWQFDFGDVPELRAWSHPLRLFMPYLPGLDSLAALNNHWFSDTYESYGQGSPGLYVVLLGLAGLWQTRRQVSLWLPIVAMLTLCLLYHPVVLPTLKVFPWFSFNRHGGRASLVYPVLFCLLALPLRWPSRRPALAVAGLIGLLMLGEWYHGYHLRLFVPTDVVSPNTVRYCNYIRAQPGEAVLDWPFCVVGANGVGAREGLCPFYEQQNAVFTFRRFYDKKVVGQYFGRLHPDQIRPFLRDHWPQRLNPDRSFTEADWQFFDTYLRQNNFAGINLYPDLLTAEARTAFYRRYGPPAIETRFPSAGRVQFIPLKLLALPRPAGVGASTREVEQ